MVALLGAIYYVAFQVPLEEEINAARARHTQLEQHLSRARVQQAEFIRLRQELAEREPLDRMHLRMLPEQAEMASFLQDLNRLAEMSGLRVLLVEPRPEEPQEQYIRLPVALKLSGRYHQIARFFYNVSQLERIISMDNIKLFEPKLVDEEVVLSVEVLATTYRRPSESSDVSAPTSGAS
ncbi:MAG: type 4a pilus biogenesis protein PilO [Sandaracinaceae bacterium]|nr:type 4a pilus biogenesis protein PilO [Sandaracinaceae bacterium]